MNIFKREIKANMKSLLIWSLSVIFMVVAGMAKFSGTSGSSKSMNDLMASLPKSIQALFGTISMDLSKAIDFYGVVFFYIAIMAAVHALMLGANIISKEEADKTAEFLMAKPVSRNKIITSKLMAALINIIIINLVSLISSISIVSYFDSTKASMRNIEMLMAGMFLLQLIFFFTGTFAAAISNKPKGAASKASLFLTAAYFLSVIININDKLEPLKYFTPFKYFEAKEVLHGNGFLPVYIIISFVLIVVMLICTYYFYNNRDLEV